MQTFVIEIKESTPEIKRTLEHLQSLTGVTLVPGKTKKKSFKEAAAECDAVPAEEFFMEVRRQIKEHYDNHA